MRSIVLFDGECHFCNKSVQFIIKRDPSATFSFASLQGSVGQKLAQTYNFPPTLDSFILIERGKMYDQSTAALRVARQLRGLWKISYACIIIPKPLRDIVYRFIAKNRKKWFGSSDACPIPTPEMRKRILDN